MKYQNRMPKVYGVSQIDLESVSYSQLIQMLFSSKQFAIIHPTKKLKFVKNWENLKRAIDDKRLKPEYLRESQIIDLTLETFSFYED